MMPSSIDDGIIYMTASYYKWYHH